MNGYGREKGLLQCKHRIVGKGKRQNRSAEKVLEIFHLPKDKNFTAENWISFAKTFPPSLSLPEIQIILGEGWEAPAYDIESKIRKEKRINKEWD